MTSLTDETTSLQPLANNVENIDLRQVWTYTSMTSKMPLPVGNRWLSEPHKMHGCLSSQSPHPKRHLPNFVGSAAFAEFANVSNRRNRQNSDYTVNHKKVHPFNF